jgi:hypothetical protein
MFHDLQFGGRCDESVAAYGIGRVGIGGVRSTSG